MNISMITIVARLKACRASLWRRGDTGHYVSITYFMSSLLHLYKHTLLSKCSDYKWGGGLVAFHSLPPQDGVWAIRLHTMT